MKTKLIYDDQAITVANGLLGILGLITIWIATHNGVAMIGGIITGIHFQFSAKNI